jgi:hypothetical protein
MPDAKPIWSNEPPPTKDGDVVKWGAISLGIVLTVCIVLAGLGLGFWAVMSAVITATHY